MTKESKIPNPTIERLALYSRPLEAFVKSGIPIVSSEKLADLCGVNPAQVRKDLAYFGEFGVRGVGYEVQDLLREIKRILAIDKKWSLCIVGMGLKMTTSGNEATCLSRHLIWTPEEQAGGFPAV
jgi:redox-sensing transcriptional repressor